MRCSAVCDKRQTLLPAKAALGGVGSSANRKFERELARRLASAYPPAANGITLFAFSRMFFIAYRP
jgi:trans-aconitate methyltransferase